MSDRVLVPLPDGQWLALDRETFNAALIAGAAAMRTASPQADPTSSNSKLKSGDEMEAATGVPASWWATQARERRIPFRRIGRYVRFDYDEVMSCEAFQRRAIPAGHMNCTSQRDRTARVSV